MTLNPENTKPQTDLHARKPPTRASQLTGRLKQSLIKHQAGSERLVAWVQFFVVVTFSLLYSLAPKTFTSEAEFAPVPWVLGAYFLFTVLHLYVCYRRLPPDWFTYLSIAVDMALIYVLIWSFHLQYMQPPSFYLKAPTLLYVFIFIALRTLRFEVKFILFAGGSAIFGWLLMILYVFTADPGNTMVTKDYVQYLTSNSMLLGAEFDKIISMLIVTLVLATAVHRSKRLLLNSIIETRMAEDLSHFVPDQVLHGLSHSDDAPQAGQASRYQAGILFIDIANFTTMSEKFTPEEVVSTLNDYFTEVGAIMERNGGTINQFQGDAILASFEQSHEGHNSSECAIKTALEIQQRLEQARFGDQQLKLSSRIGINSGEVVGGMMGSQNRLIYTVHGDAVNLAARLEQHNKQIGSNILVSRDTRLACRDGMFEFSPEGEVKVKGRDAITQIYSVKPATTTN
ncbi:adenylate/guanylate cyclase domain-containing protein [Motiliproteus sp.]|uniref:adenylate/guanylate cyclase domain-containing protein n=1 Tax=Motiliproteus sp. TaxID=1898955 RepID=UPI003BA87555